MKSIDFVLTHFKEGVFDWRKGYRAVCGVKRRTFSIMPWLYAAAAVALGAFLFIRYQNHTNEYLAYDTAQSFTLPDGSRVILQPGSELSLKPRRNPRSVELTGTALFSVVKDPQKPFTVHTDVSYIKVLGTVFQIAGSRLDVFEGKVLFCNAKDSEGIVVSAGESASIREGEPLKDAQAPNTAVWATGKFVYEDTPLEAVLEELSAFFDTKLYCPDSGKRLTAEFAAGSSLEDIIGLIETALDVTITVER